MLIRLEQRTRVRIPPVATCLLLLLSFTSRTSTQDPRSSAKRDAFATNTKYDSSFTWHERTERDRIPSETCPQLRQCKPIHLSMLVRHGTRYPKKPDISKIDYVVSSIRHYGSKEKDIVNMMRRWQNSFEWQDTMMLAETGKFEMEELAGRIVHRFPTIFHGAKSDSLRFVSSTTNRTLDSASAFVSGVWNGLKEIKSGDSLDDPRKLKTDAGAHTDKLLRFLEKCKKWSEEVEGSPEALQEVSKFLDGPELRGVLKNITSQLGPSVLLDFSTVHLKVMWTICAMETAVYGGRSIWCDLFTPQHLQVLEYLSDLKSYWKHGYGHRLNYRPACHLLKEMLKPMEGFVSGNESSLRAQFLFGHTETLVPLYSLLGLFKDTTLLRADNFAKHTNRVFRTSQISPFGANLALVLYKCDGTSPWSKFRVMMMVNEREEHFPGWHQVSCPYEVVRMLYKDALEHCEDTCNTKSDVGNNENDHPEL
ncbi:PREDICTED: multiple inositol polyphosphate phosphatase 1-like [Branchiostoma belcheri]|uniref:Multiple inositol polyphosphate phosphatase 1 n=1 Tax=Branchiostoma belcheri TaxID=7741 RepID=A0A6P5A7X2_BRABE|nr:PREDICTED: multiple inositol polyphosphate phosphatase 1-like [Branchiostoma belcheri]